MYSQRTERKQEGDCSRSHRIQVARHKYHWAAASLNDYWFQQQALATAVGGAPARDFRLSSSRPPARRREDEINEEARSSRGAHHSHSVGDASLCVVATFSSTLLLVPLLLLLLLLLLLQGPIVHWLGRRRISSMDATASYFQLITHHQGRVYHLVYL
jgi:hypothetical protein